MIEKRKLKRKINTLENKLEASRLEQVEAQKEAKESYKLIISQRAVIDSLNDEIAALKQLTNDKLRAENKKLKDRLAKLDNKGVKEKEK